MKYHYQKARDAKLEAAQRSLVVEEDRLLAKVRALEKVEAEREVREAERLQARLAKEAEKEKKRAETAAEEERMRAEKEAEAARKAEAEAERLARLPQEKQLQALASKMGNIKTLRKRDLAALIKKLSK